MATLPIPGPADAKNPKLADLGRRTTTLRQKAGLSQQELADAADLHWTYIARIERGRLNPGYESLLKLARGLGVAPARLMPKE